MSGLFALISVGLSWSGDSAERRLGLAKPLVDEAVNQSTRYQGSLVSTVIGDPCHWTEIFIRPNVTTRYKHGETDSMGSLYGAMMVISWWY